MGFQTITVEEYNNGVLPIFRRHGIEGEGAMNIMIYQGLLIVENNQIKIDVNDPFLWAEELEKKVAKIINHLGNEGYVKFETVFVAGKMSIVVLYNQNVIDDVERVTKFQLSEILSGHFMLNRIVDMHEEEKKKQRRARIPKPTRAAPPPPMARMKPPVPPKSKNLSQGSSSSADDVFDDIPVWRGEDEYDDDDEEGWPENEFDSDEEDDDEAAENYHSICDRRPELREIVSKLERCFQTN